MKPESRYGLKGLTLWIVLIVLAWLVQLFAIPYTDPYVLIIILYAGINIILAVSLNLVNGFTGQFSMGHAGFMSVGGYTAAYLSLLCSEKFPGFIQDPVMSTTIFVGVTLAGGFMAAAVGYLVGLPSLRLKGDYLAIVTLGFGEIIRVIVLNVDAVGGPRGLPNIPALSNFGWIYSFAIFTIFCVWRLIQSSFGRDFLSVREDEIAAEAMGVNTTKAKVTAFVISSFFAGIAGSLFAHQLRYLNPQTFDFNRSFEIIIMVVLGGMGSITGSVIAAVLLTFLREALRLLQDITQLDFRMVIYSVFLIILMLTRPNGLFGTKEYLQLLPKRLRDKILGPGPWSEVN